MSEFSCILFPFLTSESMDIAKFCSVYFDKVYILTPISLIHRSEYKENYFALNREFTSDYVTYEELDVAAEKEFVLQQIKLQEDTKALQKSDVIEFINPFVEFNGIGLSGEFSSIIEGYSDIDYVDRRLQSMIPQNYVPIRTAWVEKGIDRFKRKYGSDSQAFSSFLNRIKWEALTSILFEAMVLISKSKNSVPILNETLYKQVKDNLWRLMWGHGINPELYNHPNVQDYYGLHLAEFAIMEHAPKFTNASFEDIRKIRSTLGQELTAFRSEMVKLAYEVSTTTIDTAAIDKFKKIIYTEINPIIASMNLRLKTNKATWAKKIIDSSLLTKSLASFFASVFIGTPLGYSLMIAATISGITAWLEHIEKQRQIKAENGLSFLIDLHDRLG